MSGDLIAATSPKRRIRSELAGDDDGTGCAGRSECGGPDWATRMADLLLVLLGALGLGYLPGTQRP